MRLLKYMLQAETVGNQNIGKPEHTQPEVQKTVQISNTGEKQTGQEQKQKQRK